MASIIIRKPQDFREYFPLFPHQTNEKGVNVFGKILYNKIRKHSVSGPGSNKNYRVDRQLNFTSNAIFLSISIKRNVNSLPTVPPPRYLSLHITQ